MWRRLTWEQFARAAKFFAGLTWATLELWLWGGRLVPLAFIGGVIGVTEAGQILRHLGQVEKADR